MEVGPRKLAGQQAHRAIERGSLQIRAFEIRADQARFLQIGANQAGIAQIREEQVRRLQDCVLQIRVTKVDSN